VGAIVVEGLARSFVRQIPAEGGRLARLFGRRRRETVAAVRDLSFTIGRGEKVAFIGPNGAGKSTTLKMLCGILHPSAGAAEVAGFVPWRDTRALAYRLGIVFGQRSQLWPQLPVRDSLDLIARIYGLDGATYRRQADRLIQLFAIEALLDQPARSLSLGQRMRCDLVASLLHAPDILFLDEPTIGLDVTAKALLRDHLNALAQESDTTVILTSHDTGDIERICDRVILIDHGQMVVDAPLGDLKRDHLRRKTLRLVTAEPAPDLDLPGVAVTARAPHVLVLSIDLAATPVDRVVAACLDRFQIQDLVIEDLDLEEVIKAIYAGREHAG
jgi:ABC-2 type transport system ATP-binding protein